MTSGLTPTVAVPEIGPYQWTIQALTREVLSRRPIGEFRMAGFFGAWGCGKTTLLDQVRVAVDEKVASGQTNSKLETLDAWAERQDQNLPLAVLAHLIEPDHTKDWFDALKKPGFRRFRERLLMSMSTVLRAKSGTGVADLENDERSAKAVVYAEAAALKEHAEERVRRARLNSLLAEAESAFLSQRGLGQDDRILVAIDNLDRCSPTRLVDVLESLHNFSGLTRTRFLLVGDEQALIEGIRSRYPTLHKEGARAYLEKVVSPIFRMPSLRDDPDGLRRILGALGIADCAKQSSSYSGVEISEKLIIQFCRFALDGNPRKAIHLFRCLPAFAGQWNYGARHADAVASGGAGILARWILSEYASAFWRDVSGATNRLKSSISHIDLEKEANVFDEKIVHARRELMKGLPAPQANELSRPGGTIGLAAWIVCRAQFPNDANGLRKWQQLVDGVLSL